MKKFELDHAWQYHYGATVGLGTEERTVRSRAGGGVGKPEAPQLLRINSRYPEYRYPE